MIIKDDLSFTEQMDTDTNRESMFYFNCTKEKTEEFFTKEEIEDAIKENGGGVLKCGEVQLTVPYGEMWQSVGYLQIALQIEDKDGSIGCFAHKDLIPNIDFSVDEFEEVMQDINKDDISLD